MKIYIFNNREEITMGGGFVFAHNFKAAMAKLPGVEIWDDPVTCDVCLIPSPTMATDNGIFDALVAAKRPIVLRLDNMPRNSRNRGTGPSKVIKYALASRAVVYQSQWAKSFLDPWLSKHIPVTVPRYVILNGVDTQLFYYHEAPDIRDDGRPGPVVIYSRHNRDELKGWHIAWYQYIDFARKHPGAKLQLIGRFSDELREYGFDFFDGEDVTYLGSIDDRERYAQVLRNATHFLAPYDFDACSNAVLEARATGLEIITSPNPTGGMPEVLDPDLDISLDRMAKQYYHLFSTLLTQ